MRIHPNLNSCSVQYCTKAPRLQAKDTSSRKLNLMKWSELKGKKGQHFTFLLIWQPVMSSYGQNKI